VYRGPGRAEAPLPAAHAVRIAPGQRLTAGDCLPMDALSDVLQRPAAQLPLVTQLVDAEEYTIVPRGEAEVERGLISPHSPVGSALLGHRAGEELVVRTPGGPRRLRILEVVDMAECEAR
jgi:Transcription elongation factor, GreA/GreB, C-term